MLKFAPLLFVFALAGAACLPESSGSGSSRTSATPDPSSPSASPAASASPTPTVDAEAEAAAQRLLGAPFVARGNENHVRAVVTQDGRIEIRTNLEFNRIKGDTVTPMNIAEAEASCTNCQAFAVAVQINVYERGANVIAPVNRAVAINDHCTRCFTLARAIQYVIPVDDLNAIPKDVEELVRAINREARYFEKLREQGDVDPAEVQARFSAILRQFATLDQYLTDATEQRQADATVTPSATSPGTATGTPSPSPAASGTATPTPGTETATPPATTTATP